MSKVFALFLIIKIGMIIIKKIVLFSLIILVLISGCSQGEVKNDSVKVSPSKLFQGDTVRLEPHMDMITGCVNVNYKGNKENIGLKYEIWKGGTLEVSENILSSSNENNGFDGEVSISLKDLDNSDVKLSESMELTTVIRTESGYSSSSIPVKRFNEEYGHSPTKFAK